MKNTSEHSKNSRRLLSLDCGQGYTKIVYVQVAGQGPIRLLHSQVWALPLRAQTQQELAGRVKEFIRRNAISAKQLYLTISDMDAVAVKSFAMPVLSDGEINQALKWQLKDELPFSFEEALCQRQVLWEYVDSDGARHNDVLCVLAKQQRVQEYLEFAKACGLVPVKVSISPVNYAAILKSCAASSGVAAVLDIGFKDATLSLYDRAELFFVRNLAYSSDKLTKALCGALHSQTGTLQFSYEQAEEIKVACGIVQDASGLVQGTIPAIHVISLMRPLLEGLAREIKRSFDYFTTVLKKEAPGILYITGGGAALKHLDAYLARELMLPVELLPVRVLLEGSADTAAHADIQLSSALGASLGAPDNGINLLPPELRTRRLESAQRVWLAAIAGILVLGMFLFLSVARYKMRGYQSALRRAQVRLEAVSSIKELKQEIDQRERLIAFIQKERTSEEALLKLVGACADQGIMVQELVFDQLSHVLALKGVVTVSGKGVTAEAALADFIKKMKSSWLISGASLVSSENKNGIQEFEVRCNLRTS